MCINRRDAIVLRIEKMKRDNLVQISKLTDRVSIEEYAALVREQDHMRIWTEALQSALNEHQVVVIPASSQPYYIDASIRMPSNRRIEAEKDAIIRLSPDLRLLLLRNEHTQDGTHKPIDNSQYDSNISIDGGRWEESWTKRLGYGKSGMYDAHHSMNGVSTCMLFNNIEHLTLTNMTFAHTAAFAVQLGNARNVVIENVTFDSGYADGIHINGNTENILVRNISGEVGDDLVALNTYDWQNSSVNFGPGRYIFCENIVAEGDKKYKSIRLEQGLYTYDDGSTVDCSLTDTIIKGVRGVKTFKLYYQTPRYLIGEEPEKGAQGSLDGIFFEDIDIDLSVPVDKLDEYLNSDPVRGWFGAFELGNQIGRLSLKDIRLQLYPEKYPLTRLIIIGPKSARAGDFEIFDPYISNTVEHIELENITVNGRRITDAEELIHITRFDDINHDGKSSGSGTLQHVVIR